MAISLNDLLASVQARRNQLQQAKASGVLFPDLDIDTNTTQNVPSNVSQFGPVDATMDSYKQAAEYAKESEDWAILSQQIYDSLKGVSITDMKKAVKDAQDAAAIATANQAIVDGWVKDMSVSPFAYTANGGETSVIVPSEFTDVKVIYINGSRQEGGDDFTYDKSTHVVNLTYPLQAGDRVTILSSSVYEQSSTLGQTLQGVGGAEFVISSDGKSVQHHISTLTYFTTPEAFGAIGDGIVDDTAAIQAAVDSLKNNSLDLHFKSGAIYKITSPIKLPFIVDYDKGVRKNYCGHGCTLITTGDFEPFNQYSDSTDKTSVVVKVGCNFFDFTIRGFGNKDSKYNDVIHTHGISFAYGRVERVNGFGLCNVVRAYGETVTRDLYGDDLRNALYSCYATQADPTKGNNKLFNASVGWVSGDGLILKGPDIYVDGFTYDYAGCISLNAQDGVSTVRGAGVSCGADGQATTNVTILNVSGKFYGANGLSVAADNVFIGGVINVGSYYPDNFIVAKTGEAFYFDINNAQIGDLYSNKCHKGMVINPSSNNFKIGKVNFISKSNVTQSQLFSISDATNRTITNAYIEGIYLHGTCTLNDEVYLNTEDLKIDEIYLADVANIQGGRVINFARPCKVGTLHTITRSASADNDILHIDSAAQIDNIIIDHTFGTAITIKEDVVPIIGNVSILRKQGVKQPIVIKGVTGTSKHIWGDVRIMGGSIARPTLTGILYMASYSGPKWVAQGVTHPAEVYFPEFVKADIS